MSDIDSGASAPDTGSQDTGTDVSDEVVDQEVDEGSEAPAEQAAKPAPKVPNVKKFKLKVDGKDEDFDLDMDDEEGIKRHLQMSRAALKRMDEAATTRKQAESFIRRLQSDPVSVLTDPNLGVDFRAVAEKYILSQIEDEMLSPEQKRVQQAEKIIREREEEVKKATEHREAQEAIQLESHYANEHQKKITEALTGSGLPKTARTVKRMAELMYKNLNMGLNLEPSQLAQMVKEDYQNEMKELFGSSEGDILVKLMGDDVANKIRKHDLAKLRSGQPSFANRPDRESSAPKEPVKQMSKDEWRAYLDKRSRS